MAENVVLKFDSSAKAYKRLADKRLDEDDLEGALTLLLEAKERTKYVLAIYFDIAEIYYEMGLYEYSLRYWFRALDRAPKYDLEDIYNGLGACYYNLGNFAAATYYFNQQFLVSKDGSVFLEDDILDSIAGAMSEPEFKVVYPPEEADYTDLMRRAKAHMLRGENAEARALYAEVPEGAKEYDTAQLESAVAAFLSGDAEEGISISKKVFARDGENVFAICNLSSMYKYRTLYMLSDMYFSKLDENKAKNDDELYKIATACMEHAKYDRAARCFERLLADRPYDMQLAFLKGVAQYNARNFGEARRTFGRIVRLTEVNPPAASYFRRADEAERNGVKSFHPLPNFFKPVEEEEAENTKKLALLIKTKNDKVFKKRMKERDFWDLMDWAFFSIDKEIRRCACFILAVAETKQAEKYLLDKLLDPVLNDEIKAYIVELFVLGGYDKTVGAVMSSVYKKVCFYPLSAEDDAHGSLFISAYALCYSKCVLIGDYDMRKVYDAANTLYFLTDGSRLFRNLEANTLAALIYLRSEVEKVVAVEDAAALFGCRKEELMKLMEETENI